MHELLHFQPFWWKAVGATHTSCCVLWWGGVICTWNRWTGLFVWLLSGPVAHYWKTCWGCAESVQLLSDVKQTHSATCAFRWNCQDCRNIPTLIIWGEIVHIGTRNSWKATWCSTALPRGWNGQWASTVDGNNHSTVCHYFQRVFLLPDQRANCNYWHTQKKNPLIQQWTLWNHSMFQLHIWTLKEDLW